MPRITHAMKDAQLAVKDSKIYQLTIQLRDEQRRNQELRDQLEITQRALHGEPMTQRQLMDKCRDLAAQGVPCKLRGDHIYHSITNAIIV